MLVPKTTKGCSSGAWHGLMPVMLKGKNERKKDEIYEESETSFLTTS
jgi:hypothetical protein